MPKDLTKLLAPRGVAVIGASPRPGSVAGEILRNVVRCGYTGAVYPVNPKYDVVDDLQCYRSVSDLPSGVDLAVLAINRDLVLDAVEECAQTGIHNLVIITAGFKESGDDGVKREERLERLIEEKELNVVGPNCMGIINSDPAVCLNASFSRWFPHDGEIAFVSQSGSLGETVLEFFAEMNLGISQFVNLGNRAGLSENDFLEHLANDDHIRLVFLYLESFADPYLFRRLVERVGRSKPVVVLKSGRTQAGAAAVASHTGSLTTSDAIVDAFLTQSGAIRVSSIKEALTVLGAVKWGVIPESNKTVILTNAGGAGIIAADACEREQIAVPALAPAVTVKLASFLPPEAGLGNPIDMIATASSADYERTLHETLPTVDAAIVIFRPPLVFKEATEAVADGIVRVAEENPGKPILVCTLSRSADLSEFRNRLAAARVPVYTMPEAAVDALASLCYVSRLRRVKRAPDRHCSVDREQAMAIVDKARAAGREALTFAEGAKLLSCYGIPVCSFSYVDEESAIEAFAAKATYPLVAKVDAPDLFHRFEHGAVITGIKDVEGLRAAFHKLKTVIENKRLANGRILLQPMLDGRELILGMNRDRAFGAVLMFGIGGTFVEALKDVSFGVSPVSVEHARSMIQSIRAFPLLREFRGQPAVDISRLATILHRLGRLSLDIPQIAEIDLNPFMAGQEMAAVDVLIRLQANSQHSG